jgi:hypothetical protein
VVHLLLAALFGTPVAIAVLAARYAMVNRKSGGLARRVLTALPGLRQMANGQVREGSAVLAAMLLAGEMWVAVRFLGELMVITLILMMGAVLAYGFTGPADEANARIRRHRSERFALGLMIAGVVTSAALFFGYKNRPGAYQGSPSYYMDPNQDGLYQFRRLPVPSQPPAAPVHPERLSTALTTYGRAFQGLLGGYYTLDRNYNYDFHNRLFLRSTPLLADYRAAGLRSVHDAERLRREADQLLASAEPPPAASDPLGAFLEEVRAYAAFTFDRAPILEEMSERFAETEAGLQHSTHLYEGEGKALGEGLGQLLSKHHVLLDSPTFASMSGDFVARSRSVHEAYANRIVGF